MPFFEITHKEKNTRARTGIIHTDHGDIETPIFMPVGTQGTVKTLDNSDLHNLEAQIILGNTYHLHLRPGEDLIAEFGGLHKFMNWDRPILTDSGGFQVFSLGAQKHKNTPPKVDASRAQKTLEQCEIEKITKKSNEQLVKIDEEGVTFRSYIDGSKHRFTPENATEIQHKIGADIIMAFDECTPDNADLAYTKKAMDRTHRWAERCIVKHKALEHYSTSALEHFSTNTQYKKFLFGIIQGANHKELREESAKTISNMDFDGIAIGGESIGYNMKATKDILNWIYPIIPEDKPHYTMGVGFNPTDLFDVVEQGIDMFDCVAPTRLARNGALYIQDKEKKHRINIDNLQFKKDQSPIDQQCTCYTCQHHSRAYLYHLFKAEELLAYRLATIHNVHFFLNLMKQIRNSIKDDNFLELKQNWM